MIFVVTLHGDPDEIIATTAGATPVPGHIITLVDPCSITKEVIGSMVKLSVDARGTGLHGIVATVRPAVRAEVDLWSNACTYLNGIGAHASKDFWMDAPDWEHLSQTKGYNW